MGVVLPQPVQFGKYTLFERIGRGGMADVFKARVQGPAGFERVFVVKRILPHLSDDPTFTKMFIEEAKLSARLSHPNIVQVFELGNVESEYFISMEYVRGRDLSETMRTLWARIGPPRPELVAYIGREMCRALGYAHDLTGDDGSPIGMIHRDISPSNVMLSYEGAVKILDFGIAKALGGDQRDEGGTQRGTLKGKFAYMAPEQTQGSDVDRRIDIFAAGIVLHETLTGRRLFKGENDLQTVEKVRQCDVPPPSLQNPLCPPELDAIVLKALAKHREDRFQTATDMADALDDVVHAARFQPSHLAQLMRDLFPGDAGGDGRSPTGSSRVSQSMSGSSSRPYSAAVRSPTIPPVSVSRSVSAIRATQSQSVAALQSPPPSPFWKRGSVLLLFLLLGAGAFVGGAAWMQQTAPPTTHAGPAEDRPKMKRFPLKIDSVPDGAEVYVLGTGKVLGKTPFVYTFEYREDQPIVLQFKLKDYEEVTKEVSPMLGLVPLRKVRRATKPTRAENEKAEAAPSETPPPATEPPPLPATPEPAPEPAPSPTPATAAPAVNSPAAPPARPPIKPDRKRTPKRPSTTPKGPNDLENPFGP